MNKTNHKRIVLSLGILTILAFGIMLAPAKADAQVSSGVSRVDGYPRSNRTFINDVVVYQTPIYAPAPTPTVYSNSSTGNQSVAVAKAAPKKVAVASKPAAVATSDLAANAIYGSNSFLPSGIIQWIFFAILVLLVVILARKIFGASDNYHATALKHE